jgi:hypothetical protein
MPWWSWISALTDMAPNFMQPPLQAIAMGSGFALNTVFLYILTRVAWLATRPNNSFKPKPLGHMAVIESS